MTNAPEGHDGGPLVRRSAVSTVASLFANQARIHPDRTAAEDRTRRVSYRELDERSRRLASVLAARGVGRGSRLAILSENRLEYLEVFIAGGLLGAIVACQNWRLAASELGHCLDLVEPRAILVSPRYEGALAALDRPAGEDGPEAIVFGEAYEDSIAAADADFAAAEIDAEEPFLILYTSGTTGLPKGAVISHRAEVARNVVLRAEFGIMPDDTYVAWPPLYHMGAAECALGTLMAGGKIIVADGFDKEHVADVVAAEKIGWLHLMPGMVDTMAGELKRRGVAAKGMPAKGMTVCGVRVCGVMADLVPPAEIAEITTLLGAPYANTFGATETGCPPGSASLIPIGVAPENLSKTQSPYCEVRLVDADDNDVPDGTPGELCMRGPTLFSGYWRAPEVNAVDFRGGWFHMGDVFVRNPDGTLDFVDRVKYMIKSGGENIYPAEIERVMMQDPRVADVAVVRRPDDKWGEVPVAFVARRDETLAEDDLLALCRAHLAGFKQPKGIHFIAMEAFPRSASGKIQRHELEKRL